MLCSRKIIPTSHILLSTWKHDPDSEPTSLWSFSFVPRVNRKSNKYQFDSLWLDSTEARTHDLLHSGEHANLYTTDAVMIFLKLLLNILCHNVCQWLATGRWFSPGTQVSSTNKIDRHEITEMVLKVALNTITLTLLNIYILQLYTLNYRIIWHLLILQFILNKPFVLRLFFLPKCLHSNWIHR